MFVVMSASASEAEILGVKSRILAEGLTPYEHAGATATVLAVVGEVADRREQLIGQLAAHARRRAGHADLPPVQADVARVPSRGHRDPRARCGDRRRLAHRHGRPLLGREPRAADGDGDRGQGRRARRSSAAARSSRGRRPTPSRAWASRRSATSPRRARRRACRSSPRSWSRTRSTSSRSTPTSSRSARGTCRTTRCSGRRAGGAAGDAQARLRRDRRGVADGRRVHRRCGQPERDPVRARHPDVRDVHPEHAGSRRRAAAPPPDAPAGHRRPEPRHREALARPAAGAGRRGRRRRRRDGRGPPRPRLRAVRRGAAAQPR